MKNRSALVVAGISGMALFAAAGCSSSGSSTATSAAPSEVPSMPTAAASEVPTPTSVPTAKPDDSGGATTLPAAPAGAKLLGEHKAGSNEYARYKISMPPKKVVNKYKNQAKKEGYSITNAGGSGGGWGGYGGSDYGMTAKKGDAYREVQAGGESGAPTYYEVCVSANNSRTGLAHCDRQSESDSNEDSRSNRS